MTRPSTAPSTRPSSTPSIAPTREQTNATTEGHAGGQWHHLWPAPVLITRIPDVGAYNAQLKDLILHRQATAQGQRAGIVDADKTRSDLLKWDDPLIGRLHGWIGEAAHAMNTHTAAGDGLDMIAEAWAVTYRDSGYHLMHHHPGSVWSGVYYVHLGEVATGHGTIEFLDPRPAAAAAHPTRSPLRALTPQEGMLLAFPSWLQHWVTPYQSTGPKDVRVCVAFNVGFDTNLATSSAGKRP